METEKNTTKIDALGVYELRKIARGLGVKSPTTKKVEELKSDIDKIMKGEIVPEKTSTRGRPPKNTYSETDTLITTLVPDELDKLSQDYYFESKNGQELHLGSLTAPSFVEYDSQLPCNGVIRISEKGNKYLWTNNENSKKDKQIIYIPKSFPNYDFIYEGDNIVGTSVMATSSMCRVLETILEINGKSYDNLSARVTLNPALEPGIEKNTADMMGFDIYLGGRYVYHEDCVELCNFEIFQELAIERPNTENVLILLTIEEDYDLPEFKSNTQVFASKLGDTYAKSASVMRDATNHIRSLIMDGINAHVYMIDLMHIKKTLGLYYAALDPKQETPEIQLRAINDIRRVYGLANQYKRSNCCVIGTLSSDNFSERRTAEGVEKLYKNLEEISHFSI